tara:strand:- start:1549 stop:3312 length:1764 start_codon:yes stop_codon:yes gene_type:complete
MRFLKIIVTAIFLSCISHLSAQGGWQWAASHGGDVSSPTEVIKHLQTDQWGNVYIAGSINDIYQRDSLGNILYGTDFFPLIHNYGQSDIWVAKYSPTGKKLWQEYAGSGGRDQLFAMTVDDNGNSYITGALSFHFSRPPFMFNQVPVSNDSLGTFIAKLDSGGTLQWHRTFGYDTINNRIVYIGVQGLKIINNKLSLFVSPGPGQSFLFNSVVFDEGWHAVELNLNGNYMSKTKLPFKDFISGANNLKPDFDNEGNYYLHGQFPGDTLFLVNDTLIKSPNTSADGLILAIDSNGTYKWSFIGEHIKYDSFNDAVIVGDTIFISAEATTFQVDTVRFGNVNYKPNSQTLQENILLLFDINSGSPIGLRHNNGRNNSYSQSYGIAANDNFMAISGVFDHKITFSGTSDYIESVSKSTNTNSDAFFALFDRQGNYLCEDVLYTFGNVDGIQKMAFVDSSIYVAGFFNDTLFVQGDTLIASGSNDVFLARYDLPCKKGVLVGIEEVNNNFIKAENGVLVYPNPSSGFTNLIGKPVNNTAMLIDIKGTVVKSILLDINAMQQPINLQEVKSGVYFLTIIGNDSKQVLKLIRD